MPHGCAASEVHRRLGGQFDPATIRRWAIAHGHAHPESARRARASARRWQRLKIGPDDRVPIDTQRLRVGVSPAARVVHCRHPNGAVSILAHEPKTGESPVLPLQVGNP